MEKLNDKQRALCDEAKGLARFLTLDFSLKIFGVEVISYHFPPKNS